MSFLRRKYSGDGNYAPRPPYILNRSSPQARGLIGWWPTTPIFSDFSGHANHLVNSTDPPTLNPIEPLNAVGFDFNGTSDRIRDSSWTARTVTPFSVGGWFVTDDVAATTCLWSMTDGSNNNWFSILIRGAEANDPIEFGVLAPITGFSGSKGGSVKLGQLHHVMAVALGNVTRIVYLDGVEIDQKSTLREPTGLDNWAFGRLDRGSSFLYFNGRQFGWAAWDRALSAAEVRSLYSPSSRWDLYYELGKTLYFSEFVAAEEFAGIGVQTLPSFNQAGVGKETFSGAGIQLLTNALQAGVGKEIFSGAGIQLLANSLQAGVGVMQPSGAGIQLLVNALQAGVGEETFSGAGIQLLANALQAGVGISIEGTSGIGIQLLANALQAGVGVMQPSGAGIQLLANALQAGVGVMQPSGVGIQLLANLLQAGVGLQVLTGTPFIAQFIPLLLAADIGLLGLADIGIPGSFDVKIPGTSDIGI